MELRGLSLIGATLGSTGGATFTGFDPGAGAALATVFHSAKPEEVERAVALATAAAPAWAALPAAERYRFLALIADKLEQSATSLADLASHETGLPVARCVGEISRTSGQLRLYGKTAVEGDWLDARIETAQPGRQPLPKPDHRSMLRAIGPVVVFGSSNFPFAYSVAGGDTASAFAAGCPVIVKAHPAHPGTSERVGRLVREAVVECGLPEGTFSLLFDAGFEVGQALVKHPAVKAVGFTGSLRGGRALVDLAASRPEPIPVYAEMGSINPIFILPSAIAERASVLVDGLHASATNGVGQFCTNPGVVVLVRSPAAEAFVRDLVAKLSSTPEAPMLTPGIKANFATNTAKRAKLAGVRPLVTVPTATKCGAAPAWFETDAATFAGNHALAEEIFGPSAVVVWCRDAAEMLAIARGLEGSLTGAVHAGADDVVAQRELVTVLGERAGRLIFNGYPTGLEVSPAIVHGGPYPATSDGGRSTSVGTRALNRWARLICYQNFPDDLLPAELKNQNPLGIRRLVNGQDSRAPL